MLNLRLKSEIDENLLVDIENAEPFDASLNALNLCYTLLKFTRQMKSDNCEELLFEFDALGQADNNLNSVFNKMDSCYKNGRYLGKFFQRFVWL